LRLTSGTFKTEVKGFIPFGVVPVLSPTGCVLGKAFLDKHPEIFAYTPCKWLLSMVKDNQDTNMIQQAKAQDTQGEEDDQSPASLEKFLREIIQADMNVKDEDILEQPI